MAIYVAGNTSLRSAVFEAAMLEMHSVLTWGLYLSISISVSIYLYPSIGQEQISRCESCKVCVMEAIMIPQLLILIAFNVEGT